MILKEGGLNLRFEYRINELCRMESIINYKEKEEQVVWSKLEKRTKESKIISFISVMSLVNKINDTKCADAKSNHMNSCRKKYHAPKRGRWHYSG